MNSDVPLPAKLVSLFCITLFLASCSKSPQHNTTTYAYVSANGDADHVSELLLQHVKQIDIPVPVGFNPVQTDAKADSSDKQILQYSGNLTVPQSLDFYKQAMELHGWEIQDFSTTKEGLLFCNKAHKTCALSIRPDTQSRHSTTQVTVILDTPRHYTAHATHVTHAEHSEHAEHHEYAYVASDIDIINNKKVTLS